MLSGSNVYHMRSSLPVTIVTRSGTVGVDRTFLAVIVLQLMNDTVAKPVRARTFLAPALPLVHAHEYFNLVANFGPDLH